MKNWLKRHCSRSPGSLDGSEKRTYYSISHSLRTGFSNGGVDKVRIKIKLLDKLGEAHEILLHKKTIKDPLKDYSLPGWDSVLESISMVERYSSTDHY